MEDNSEKKSLRNLLLEKRDGTSFDLMKIASEKISKKLKKIKGFRDAQKIGAYYPIGSEILTQNIIQELLSNGKQVFLPRVSGELMDFKKISDFSSLEKGSFDIMEPKMECETENNLDVVLVPTVGITPRGVRLGYGHGYYDRFLAVHKTVTISLILEKQVVKNIPKSEQDVLIDWVVTEDRIIKTQR
ncbi:5-formyltetrahydrofolate cyclo-ligase protein [Marine Group I thaumarchaeote SCGC AAA799-E16]|uniref:5-formyltetrahydrofolate cyclo-ligase protein n=4 Tax=Marine Group I TaxID=905826 RepID=A0A081RKS8_9ARCH|nr:5-formyltetrahydrofolate cyclo-ligase protein [Marine Group I thaumarchaeote SCGC AAA799-N04]KER06666.1 5-formyltetrahydrofolate cyclo-ligase protein [Marine Group I thaumarchaeote SCGC AAA799-E16]KFM16143.1 5-formyltetrahydrofolate cyclo-ligase protein [Marine Group I thaumarchaeote SCGC AAA799-D11]KFM17880.1 5-formyltetrahydrofolate cyclo-ligase protein [Marine Group I thaumarchaeote SCGC RSA3]